MNTYSLKVANIETIVRAGNEYAALIGTGLFSEVEQVEYVQTIQAAGRGDAWIYKVKLNNNWQIAYIERRG